MKVVDKMLEWENAGKTKLLSVGYSLRAPELLFRKIEDEEVKRQVEKLLATKNIKQENQDSHKMKEEIKSNESAEISPVGGDLEGALIFHLSQRWCFYPGCGYH